MFSTYVYVLGLFLPVIDGIFTQYHARGESEVHMQVLQNMKASHTDLFWVLVLGKYCYLYGYLAYTCGLRSRQVWLKRQRGYDADQVVHNRWDASKGLDR